MAATDPRTTYFTDLFVLFLMLIGAFFVAQFAALLAALPFYDFDVQAAARIHQFEEAAPPSRIALLLVQIASALTLFVGTSWLYLKQREPEKLMWRYWLAGPPRPLLLLALVCLIMLAYLPLSSWTVQWNQQLTLPASWAKLESWMRHEEESRQRITRYLLAFDTAWEAALAVLTIVLLASVGEEWLFRGILQRKLLQITDAPHVAIWGTAILFSLLHFQFFGFVPRMLLGALFGYLYHWSRTIWVPIWAHILNNGITLTVMVSMPALQHEPTQHIFPTALVWVSMAVFVLVLLYFRNIFYK